MEDEPASDWMLGVLRIFLVGAVMEKELGETFKISCYFEER